MGGLLVDPNNYVLTCWLFLRGLGAIYLVAFVSYGLQVTGLIGKDGLLPAGEYLRLLRASLGRQGYLLYPSLAWLNSSDASLRLLCIAGTLLSVALLVGIATTPVLVLLYVCYLSLVSVSQVFLSYQWDALLLETGFLAIFLVPLSLLPGGPMPPPSAIAIYLFRWLLFRLIFMSGLAKLVSGDRTWRNLTALTYHYETQPLPTPLAWYACRAPLWFHKFSTLATLFIELAIPFLYAGPDVVRYVGGGFTVLLQLLILLTGNYAFFNWLTIALAIFLYDDTFWRGLLSPGLVQWAAPAAGGAASSVWGSILLILVAAFVIIVGAWTMLRTLLPRVPPLLLRLLTPLLQVAEVGRLVNPYGLFAVMTTARPEIVIEGSNDAVEWLPFEFRYKPSAPNRPPPVVAPHQPRLDWQMWFAAVRYQMVETWFVQLLPHLLLGTQPVLALLARDPFAGHPPRYVRAVLYQYHFTTPTEKAQTGNWWRRERLGLYFPAASLQEPESEPEDDRHVQ